jgi:DNA-binding NarL/FixJ family response regulator
VESKRILIADDHAAVRTGVKHVLKSEFPGMEFGEACNAPEVLGKVRSQKWNAIILDINLPGRNGLDILKQLKAEKIGIPVLIFSVDNEALVAVRAFKAGAVGYLSKGASCTELVNAIQQLLSGKKYITPSVAELLVSHLENPENKAPHELLSDREYQTLLHIASGLTLSQIASRLSLGVSTISTYRARILKKTGLKNNARLTAYVLENKLV